LPWPPQPLETADVHIREGLRTRVLQIRGNKFSAAILKMTAEAFQDKISDGPIFI